MKIAIITHAVFEKSGSIAVWASKRGYTIQEVSPFLGEALPLVDEFDFLIVMGGPQSPLALDEAPYLADEITLIQKTLEKQKPILGICLGAQLIGEALGAKTERSPHREIGVFPLRLLDMAEEDPIFKTFPKMFDVAHWHNDMPGLTANSVLLAESEGCPRQIVRYQKNVYGFQCHLELTAELMQGMIVNCPGDLAAGKYVQSEKQLLEKNYADINARLEIFLDALIG